LQAIGCCTKISRQLTELSIREFLAKKNIPTLPHPPYSPDLHVAPCDFYLFHKLKSKSKGHHFGIVTDKLRILTENDFRYFSNQWKERWNHCVTSQGSYFEGDNLYLDVSLIYCGVFRQCENCWSAEPRNRRATVEERVFIARCYVTHATVERVSTPRPPRSLLRNTAVKASLRQLVATQQ
jgi:hypothetical protein